ncbi:protein CANDIDATE G-PROTEIN COUPLED RECEPTOR 7-like [Cornus florida]|uniref:protein CANDIDATE G-PROTEIN COUPLED RECEPTOR 7-like n=1 Tax=Cornus florida TaxID=4283 RepID=UPI0028A18784|nr:protein CANDIDATE G-PROTEIN COUPLED RECEPTOR 7-like [Cornus florida]
MGNLKFYITLHHHLLPALILFLSTIPFSACEIKNITILDDSRPIILFERFGFAPNGHVSVSINHYTWKSKHQGAQLDPSSMGFFLVRDVSFPRILNESEYTEGFCVLSSHFVKLIFRFDKFGSNSSYDGSIIIDEPDEYNLIFGNCQPEFQVSMNVHTEMYNLHADGSKDFLPAGQTPLPRLYFLFFLIYTAFLLSWVYTCTKHRQTLDKIHLIMGALLLFKALKIICASEDKMYVRKTGTPHGWDVAFYVFGFFKGVVLFTVIILIGTGWSFLKPYLQEREKKVLMIVIPLQVLENIVSAVIGETGPATKDWFTWTQVFLIMDIVCCCAVFFPIIWSMRSLKEASKMDGKAARNLEKLSLFKQFYLVVVGYLYFTRVVVAAIGSIVTYRYEWVGPAAAEAASLPIERNPYLAIDDEEEAHAGQILEADDTFEL